MSDTPQRIWLIRHGNRADFVDPSWLDTADRPHDPPLSDDGIVQARETGAWLAQHANVKHLFASPFLRATQTAQHLAEALSLPLCIEPGLVESLTEKWFPNGAPLLSPQALLLQFPAVDCRYTPRIEPSWPETHDDVMARAIATLALADEFAGDLVFASHGGFISLLIKALALGKGVHACPCCLVCIERTSTGWRLIADGYDMSHLSADPGAVRLH